MRQQFQATASSPLACRRCVRLHQAYFWGGLRSLRTDSTNERHLFDIYLLCMMFERGKWQDKKILLIMFPLTTSYSNEFCKEWWKYLQHTSSLSKILISYYELYYLLLVGGTTTHTSDASRSIHACMRGGAGTHTARREIEIVTQHDVSEIQRWLLLRQKERRARQTWGCTAPVVLLRACESLDYTKGSTTASCWTLLNGHTLDSSSCTDAQTQRHAI